MYWQVRQERLYNIQHCLGLLKWYPELLLIEPWSLQAKLDVSDEQRGALRQAWQKYRGELHALAVERKSLNSVLAQAAAPGKPDSIKKVACPLHIRPCIVSAPLPVSRWLRSVWLQSTNTNVISHMVNSS